MIKSFKCPETEKIFNRKSSLKWPPGVQKTAYRKLWYLGAAKAIEDLRVPPGNKLKALSGDREGQFSIWINDQYRICFVWDGDDAHEVEIVDYHR
jgi:proteic killer suppression protein